MLKLKVRIDFPKLVGDGSFEPVPEHLIGYFPHEYNNVNIGRELGASKNKYYQMGLLYYYFEVSSFLR